MDLEPQTPKNLQKERLCVMPVIFEQLACNLETGLFPLAWFSQPMRRFAFVASTLQAGCWHDSSQANHGGACDKSNEVCEATGGKVVVDSAFLVGNRGHFVKSSQPDPMDAQQLLTNQDTTSICQLSELGMLQIQAKFPLLKDDMLRSRVSARSP
jgi:hypothetical protein